MLILIYIFLSQCRVLLNLRTTQPFEEVLEDLGQVLKMNGAKRMYTVSGQEVSMRNNVQGYTILFIIVSWSNFYNEFYSWHLADYIKYIIIRISKQMSFLLYFDGVNFVKQKLFFCLNCIIQKDFQAFYFYGVLLDRRPSIK